MKKIGKKINIATYNNEPLLNATIHYNTKIPVEPSILCGDIDGDGKVTAKDNTFLVRHLAEWDGYEIIPIEKTADTNGDGKINARDNTTLARYLAKWTRYETLPHIN